jgi:ATP-dependent RNA helicase DDX49/DBP8
MTQPLAALQRRILRAPVAIVDLTAHSAVAAGGGELRVADNLTEEFALVPQRVKDVYAVHILERLEALNVRSVIVFCSTRRGCERFSALLHELKLSAVSLHSGKPQRARLAALYQVRRGSCSILSV